MPSPRLTTLLAGIIVVSSGLNAPFALAQTPFTPSPVPGFVSPPPPPPPRPPTGPQRPPPPAPTVVDRVASPPPAASVGFGFIANPSATPTFVPTLPTSPALAAITSLKATIAAAAAAAAASPGYAGFSPAQKLLRIQGAIAAALSVSGAQMTIIASALAAAVADNSISGATAVSVASAVSPILGAQMANMPAVSQALARESAQVALATAATPTAAINQTPTISILTPMLSITAVVTTTVGFTATPITNPAPFDPCAGVIAAYCGG